MTDLDDFDINDVSTLSLRFCEGAIGSISASCILSPYSEYGKLSRLARKAWNKAQGLTGIGNRAQIMRDYRVGISLFGKDKTLDLEEKRLRILRRGFSSTIRAGNNPYLAEDEAFLRAVSTGDAEPIRCDLDEGMKTLKLTLAAAESAEKGKKVIVGDYP
jgi:predicted dehydrogenase